jgi:glycosyltransferase involved in cell wall biosynthesis
MSALNIWYVNTYGGGPGVGRLYRPYQLATEWKKRGHDTTVFVADYHHLLEKPGPLPPQQVVEGVPYVALKSGPYKGNGLSRILNMARFCWSLWQVRKRVEQDLQKPDVIIASSPQPFIIYPARWLAKRFGAKLVFEVRDLWPLSVTEINGTSRYHPFVLLTAFTERYAYKHADLVASLLPGVETYMQERQMRYKKFVWVPNGIDDSAKPIKPVSREGLRLLGVLEDWKRQSYKVVIHPGSMGPPNALDKLIEAVAILQQQKDLKFGVLLIGEGSMRAELERTVREHNMKNVVFGGPIPKLEIKHLIANSDVGYCGGKNHSKVYKYGVSYNKIMDFIEAGITFIIPFSVETYSELNGSNVVRAATGSGAEIAGALVKALSLGNLSEQKRLEINKLNAAANFNYSTIAQNYSQAF